MPDDAAFGWPRALKKCAANYAARRVRMGLSLPMDVQLDARDASGERLFLFRLALDGDEAGMVTADSERNRLTYRLDQRLLFCLVTGLLSWNTPWRPAP